MINMKNERKISTSFYLELFRSWEAKGHEKFTIENAELL